MKSDNLSVTLVTGGCGFLGQRVVYRLAELGQRVRALVRPGTGPDRLGLPPSWLADGRVELFPASFNDMAALVRAAQGSEAIIHCAASTTGGAAAQVANTVVGSEHLFRASIEANVPRFVLVSSFGVIHASGLDRGGLMDEQVPLDPYAEQRDPYSFAKHRQEQLAWQFHRESGLPLVVVRPGVIFGPGKPILGGRIGLKLFGLFLYLGGNNQIPLVFVDNCADALIQAAIVDGILGEAFCLVDDNLPSARMLLRRYRREVEPVPFVPIPYPVLRQLARVNEWYSTRTGGHLPAVFTRYKVDAMWKGNRFSNHKAKERLGWQPRIPMKEALDLTFSALSRASI